MKKTHERLDKQIAALFDALMTFGLPVYEDEVAPDEEKDLFKDYHCFVYETGDMVNNRDGKTVTQEVTVYYYSENRDDLDNRTVDIIATLSEVGGLSFSRTQKQRLKKKDIDQYVDRVVFLYTRGVPFGTCKI